MTDLGIENTQAQPNFWWNSTFLTNGERQWPNS